MNHLSYSLRPAAALATIALLAVSSPALAQNQGASLEWSETTRMEASGILGAMLSRSAGGSLKTENAVHVLGAKLRTDAGNTSTQFDAEAREMVFLDHDARTYMRISLEDLSARMAELSEALREGHAELDAELAESKAELEEALAEARQNIEVRFEHRPQNQREQINGFQAERHHLILEMAGAQGIQGAEDVEGGSLVILMDLWLSEEFARANPLSSDTGSDAFSAAMREDPAFREFADQIQQGFETMGPGQGLFSLTMIDPRIGAAMEEAGERLSELNGTPMKSSYIIAVVPPGVPLDTEALIAWQPATMGSQLAEGAGRAAGAAARDAARDAFRGVTRGMFGRRPSQPQQEQVREPRIQPLVRVTNEVVDVRKGEAPSPDLFTIPEGYREASATN